MFKPLWYHKIEMDLQTPESWWWGVVPRRVLNPRPLVCQSSILSLSQKFVFGLGPNTALHYPLLLRAWNSHWQDANPINHWIHNVIPPSACYAAGTYLVVVWVTALCECSCLMGRCLFIPWFGLVFRLYACPYNLAGSHVVKKRQNYFIGIGMPTPMLLGVFQCSGKSIVYWYWILFALHHYLAVHALEFQRLFAFCTLTKKLNYVNDFPQSVVFFILDYVRCVNLSF